MAIQKLFLRVAVWLLVASTTHAQSTIQDHHRYWVYIGCSSNDGIGLYQFDADTGTLTAAGTAGPAQSPGFLATSPDQKFLYATVNLKGNAGGIEGFAINAATGKLTEINRQASGGEGPTFVSVDPSGTNVLVANYGSATVSVLPVDRKGELSPASCVIQQSGSGLDPQRQQHAYAHSINCDPSGKFAVACDLGADKLFIYRFDKKAGLLSVNTPATAIVPAGSGPRHLTFSRDGNFCYVINELNDTIIAYRFNADQGTLTDIQTVTTLKDNVKGSTCAEVQIDPQGRFLYASNRLTTNYLTIFSIDPVTGTLMRVGYQDCFGKTPRNFRIDPSGHFLLVANQDSNSLTLFAIDQHSGQLTAVGRPFNTVHAPTCVKFVSAQADGN
jgi:6-phosphogluconolactonase